MIVLLMLIPIFYLGFHKVPDAWLLWLFLAGSYFAVLYAYLSKARRKARGASRSESIKYQQDSQA
jgi:hypothetical protein